LSPTSWEHKGAGPKNSASFNSSQTAAEYNGAAEALATLTNDRTSAPAKATLAALFCLAKDNWELAANLLSDQSDKGLKSLVNRN